jgi:hypothetical protein
MKKAFYIPTHEIRMKRYRKQKNHKNEFRALGLKLSITSFTRHAKRIHHLGHFQHLGKKGPGILKNHFSFQVGD